MGPPCSFFIRMIDLSFLGPLRLHMNFRIILSISAKNPAGILTEIVLNLSVSLGSECRHPNRKSAFRKRGVSFSFI